MRHEFNALHQQIRSFAAFKWGDSECQQKMQEVVALWYRAYHLLAGVSLAVQSLDLATIESPLVHFAQKVLALQPSGASLQKIQAELMTYRAELRTRFIAGERLPFLPAMRLVYTLNLLENLAQCRLKLNLP